MESIIIPIEISKDEYLKYYKGHANQVFAVAIDGRTISFPAQCLKPFVDHNGIKGVFRLSYNAQGKLIDIERLSIPP